MATRPGTRTHTRVQMIEEDSARGRSDYVATEEPLEIRLAAGGGTRTVAVTMRTPGADFELAAGFLFAEGIIASKADVERVAYCTDPGIDREQQFNIVTVELARPVIPDLRRLERHSYTSSACGVCGKASIESLQMRGCAALPPGPEIAPEVLFELPGRLREAQGIFESTGGLHAAGLFTPDGDLVALREDVGRHNAVDKLVGWAVMQERIPLHEHVLMVSGRTSFEILQKAVVAGLPIVCAVSAPSSLAVDVARDFGVTLVGFLRDRRGNVYAGDQRIAKQPAPATR